MGVAQKTTFSKPESLKKILGVSGDLMEYNERGKPLKMLSSLTNPKSAGQLQNGRARDGRAQDGRALISIVLHGDFFRIKPH